MPSSTRGSTHRSRRSRHRSFASALVVSAFLLALFATSASATEAAFSFAFGSNGTGDGQFKTPKGSAVDKEGNLWVADSGNKRVQRFYGSSGEFISKFVGVGGAAGIAIDSSGNLLVTDTINSRVQKFNSKGELLSSFGTAGSGNGQFNNPEAIAIDSGGNIWVVDTGNNRVQKFNASGVYQSKFGSAGSENGQLSGPSGIAIDAAGSLWVTDTGNNRLQKFSAAGTYLSKFGTLGSGNGQLSAPSGNVAIDSGGMLWVTDTGNNRVQEFTPSGSYYWQFGSKGSGEGQFTSPRGVSVDSAGSLFVTDQGNSRVQKWSRPPAVPTNLELPVVSPSTPHVGTLMSTTNGTWTGSPDNYGYQWYRGGTAISGATQATYTTSEADLGSTLSVKVTAIDSESSETGNATSKATATVAIVPRIWYACKTGVEGGTHYEDPACTKESAKGAFAWSAFPYSVPTAFKAKNTGSLVINATVSGIAIEVSCSTQESAGELENTKAGGGGVLPGGLKFTGCTVLKPSNCTIFNPFEIAVEGEDWEYEAKAALKLQVEFAFTLQGSKCGLSGTTVSTSGIVIAKMNNATSSIEFFAAGSKLMWALKPVTIVGTTKLETGAGEAVSLQP
jgi:sugar lactone lactonase YvrE